MINEKQHYDSVDMPFYYSRIFPFLPKNILDFHTHIWVRDHWKVLPWETDAKGGNYMVVEPDHSIEQLISRAGYLFPEKNYNAVCFGLPTPAADIAKSNAYAARAKNRKGFYPLLLAGRGLTSSEELNRVISEEGFYGYKVFLPWQGNDYGKLTVEELISPLEMEIAEKNRLVVLLHVPRAGRLADPVIGRGVRAYALDYPNASIVLAHCGRCYHPDEMRRAVNSIKDLENVYLDTSMVMEPEVFHTIFSEINSSRVLFGTDFPVAKMRGRRVYVMDHWIDLVLEGYPPGEYRVSGSNFSATFMAYEIITAILRAAKNSGLSKEKTGAIFYDNGMKLLQNVNRN